MAKAKRKRGPFSNISLPTPLIREVKRVVDELGYWPTKTDFVREAVVQKLERHKKELAEQRQAEEAAND